MAGDWIKVRHGLRDEPEVVRMAFLLKISPEEVVGRLVNVWEWLDKVWSTEKLTHDGFAVIVLSASSVDNSAFVDRIAGLTGFAGAMASVGWLCQRTNAIAFPNAGRHNLATAKERARSSRLKAESRSAAAVDKSPEKAAMKQAEKQSPKLSRSDRDKNGTTGEDRTEEEKPDPPNAGEGLFHNLAPEKKPKRGSRDPMPVVSEDFKTLNTPGFCELWELWCQHRREKDAKAWTPTAARMCLKDCAAWGVERALIALKHCIQSGSTKLYEPERPKVNRGYHGRPERLGAVYGDSPRDPNALQVLAAPLVAVDTGDTDTSAARPRYNPFGPEATDPFT